jgi:GH25 family lysozyme M1 (1,4-beta-N-acetylmuramidase)
VDRIMKFTRRQLLQMGTGALAAPLMLGADGPQPSAPAPTAPPPLAGYPTGIDVASYQGYPDWDAVASSGISFAFTKATEGTTYTNPTFNYNWAWMAYEGLYRGAYHFARPGSYPSVYDNAVNQADYFLNVVQPQSGDLQMVLDLEVTGGLSPSALWAWTQAFINEVYYWTGAPGIIYTGYYFWRDSLGNPRDNLNCPLWLAAYVSDPSRYVPAAWGTWSFWQYTSSGRVPGISGNVDLDYFNGGLDRLALLTIP